MIDETDAYPTQEELRHAMDKAVRRGLMKANGDGTFSITDDGKEWVEEFLLTPDTIH
jgi:predicted transcriptional regulator